MSQTRNTEPLCPTCGNSIYCPTWSEVKCTVKEKRIYGYKTMTVCGSYKKRPKDFKEPRCRCEDCLKNELLAAERLEEED